MKQKFSLSRASLLVAIAATVLAGSLSAQAQLLFSAGSPYSQNFDGLGATGTDISTTILPGWLIYKSVGVAQVTTATVGAGGSGTGGMYNYGTASATDRALGSVGSGTPGNFAYGVQFQNDTANSITNIVISYTGEQWRNGGNASAQTLGFSYQIASSALANSDPAVSNAAPWTYVSALDFVTPTVGATAAALDGNAAANRTVISARLNGVSVAPGQYVVFRWYDANDTGNDHGVALDDLTITWTGTAPNNNPPTVTTNPSPVTVYAGNNANFSVTASGAAPLTYQWYSVIGGVTNAVGINSSALTLTTVTTNAAGDYFCNVSNGLGNTNSAKAQLTVLGPVVTNIAYLRTLIDANYALTNTNALYQIEGVCTTPVSLVSGASVYSFHIQDATGRGIDIFHRGGFIFPAQGEAVRVVGPLIQFSGLSEINPVAGNPAHSITSLSNGVALPAARYLDLANLATPAVMEDFEGSLVVVSNVTVANATTNITFPATNVTLTISANGQSMSLIKPANASDLVGYTIPTNFTSIRGVISQSDNSSPFSSGYQLIITLASDLNTNPPPVSVPQYLQISRSANNVIVTWTNDNYVIQSATNAAGPYTTVTTVPSPFTDTTNAGLKFYRLTTNTVVGGGN